MTLSVDIPFTHALALWSRGELVYAQGDLSQPYPLASVTKLSTAWSVLVAVDQGLLSLDDPAVPEGATVRHLLAHASGLPYDSRDAQVAPAKRRIYSNAGFEILGDLLEKLSGMPIERWIACSVFDPLGMKSAELKGSPAWGATACVTDLLLLGREILDPHLVSSDLAADALSVHFPELAGVVPGYGRHTPCPWGLGCEIKGHKSPHWMGASFPERSVGHFGVSGSFLWVDRDHDATCAFVGAEAFGPWHKNTWSLLNEELHALVR